MSLIPKNLDELETLLIEANQKCTTVDSATRATARNVFNLINAFETDAERLTFIKSMKQHEGNFLPI